MLFPRPGEEVERDGYKMAPPGLPLQSELSLGGQDGMEEYFDKIYYYAEQIVIDILPFIEFKKCKITVK